MAPQSFDCLLLYRGWSDTQILETGQSWVLHVCCVKLEKQSSGLGIESFKVSFKLFQEDSRCKDNTKTWLLPYQPCQVLSRAQMGSLRRTGQQDWKNKNKVDQNLTVVNINSITVFLGGVTGQLKPLLLLI